MTITTEQRNDLIAVIAKVSLGPTFEYEAPNPELDMSLGKFRNILYNSAISVMSESWGQKGKFHICMDMPKDSAGNDHLSRYNGDERTSSINIAYSKTPAQIANEIERRLMADFMRLSTLNYERIHAADKRKAERVAIGDRLHAQFPDLAYHNQITNENRYHNDRDGISFDNYGTREEWPTLHVTVTHSGTIDIKVDSLSPSEAEIVLDAIQLLRQNT